MFRSTTTYEVSPATFMSTIFPNGLPINAFIDKGRCGIGGTTLEVKDKSRSTIIVVPSISILISKSKATEVDEQPDFIVYGKKSQKEVTEFLKGAELGVKIMTTPEGMRKIMRACTQLGMVTDLYKNWFLLLDECHTFITEAFRKDILLPFDYFWQFDNKSIISATPYYFSDLRFYSLDLHKITFTDILGTITLVNSDSVEGTLNYVLTNSEHAKGNLHIFYNSVTAIRNAILRAGITDCNIFCADDNDHANMEKLGELKKHYVEEPNSTLYKKFNFYTSKYFEGWDLKDKDATIILVTDYHNEHSKIGVSKGKQALGRLRTFPDTPAEQILHITNHQHQKSMTSIEEYEAEYAEDAKRLINRHNDDQRMSKQTDAKLNKFKYDNRVEAFADINQITKLAVLNPLKLDQRINEAASNEIYKNIKFVRKAWEDAYFKVEEQYSNKKLESKTTIGRKSEAKKLEEDYHELEKFNEEGASWFYFGESVEEEIKRRNPIAYEAYKLIDAPTMKLNKWNVKKVSKLVIEKSNEAAEVKLLKLLKRTFLLNTFYFNSEIIAKLQSIYNKLQIKDTKTDKIRVAEPSQLAETNRFLIEKSKRKNSKGQREHGYVITGYSLLLKVTD